MDGNGKWSISGIIVVIVVVCIFINRCSPQNSSDISYGTSVITQASDNESLSTGIPLSGNELKSFAENEAESGLLRKLLMRFSVYAASKGIQLNQFNQKDEVNDYFTQLMNSEESIKQNSYHLGTESAFLQDDYFVVYELINDSGIGFSPWFYIGEVNSNNQPHGKGLIGLIISDSYLYESPTYIITYIGEFKNGRKNGYGVQFYFPDSFYIPSMVKDTAAMKLSDDGTDKDNENYGDELSSLYHQIISSMVNIPIYEGEFKNNKLSGKGNYSCPFVGFVDEFSYTSSSDSESYRYTDAELVCKYYERNDSFMMDTELYVGSFDNNKPINAKYYEYGKMTFDGKWKDFAEPIS